MFYKYNSYECLYIGDYASLFAGTKQILYITIGYSTYTGMRLEVLHEFKEIYTAYWYVLLACINYGKCQYKTSFAYGSV